MEEPVASTEATPRELDEGTRFILSILLVTVGVVFVFGHQVFGNGALSSPEALFAELHADEAEPLEKPWGIGEELPYRYRPLYRAVVLAVYDQLPHEGPEAFYGLFVTAGAITLLLAALIFDWYLREIGFSGKQALWGTALFLFGFPVLFSYDMPIHTREDFLGYAWITLTLIAVARDRPWAVVALGVVGVSIRETCLLGVLPYFLVSKRPRWQQGLAYAIPGAAWLALRVVRSTGVSYPYWQISSEPTLAFPLEAALYLFACFGCLWVAAGVRLRDRDAPRHPLLGTWVVLLAFALTASTGWTMGMIRENRITYILAPFVIPLALAFFDSPRGRRIARCPQAWIAGAVVLGLGLAGLAWLRDDPRRVIPLQAWIGKWFHPGAAPVELMADELGWIEVEQSWASPMNGPVVLVHLAASTWLAVGAWLTRERLGSVPEEATE